MAFRLHCLSAWLRAEGALKGASRRGIDLDHGLYARECAIDIPGRRPMRRCLSRANTNGLS